MTEPTEPMIGEQSEFDELCRHIRESGIVGFDTEFVSEYTYRPQLCLLQFATPDRQVTVDPFEIGNLDQWWEIMADDETTVVVHAGQAEIRFCLQAISRLPKKLVDVQLAEGLRTRSYPLSYSALVSRVLDRKAHGKETRTDWRRRPLSSRQSSYALEDVEHLLEIWSRQQISLSKLGRLEWAEVEFQRLMDDIVVADAREDWRRLPGIHKLRARELAVARELCEWREAEADSRNQPLKGLLRDDLIIDLARRCPRSVDDLLATRDMNRPRYKRCADELVIRIERAMNLSDSELPRPGDFENARKNQDEHVLGQLLNLALANRCSEMEVSRQLVATSADLRQLVRWHNNEGSNTQPPRVAQGWRADVCGDLLTNLLDGKLTLRVNDSNSDHPLIFEPTQD